MLASGGGGGGGASGPGRDALPPPPPAAPRPSRARRRAPAPPPRAPPPPSPPLPRGSAGSARALRPVPLGARAQRPRFSSADPLPVGTVPPSPRGGHGGLPLLLLLLLLLLLPTSRPQLQALSRRPLCPTGNPCKLRAPRTRCPACPPPPPRDPCEPRAPSTQWTTRRSLFPGHGGSQTGQNSSASSRRSAVAPEMREPHLFTQTEGTTFRKLVQKRMRGGEKRTQKALSRVTPGGRTVFQVHRKQKALTTAMKLSSLTCWILSPNTKASLESLRTHRENK
ncbi:WAS/WASL-interacting protein family member 1 [Bubalus bubalis]|uniref:WAS/WASL-interacting protein family member 1 n=1 Tax=Bubalus bubalis TaxID=89462 RepID=UPI001D1172E9|nr:WAS/WASL-interacting protein family member 1 [Bubalus bubalis]